MNELKTQALILQAGSRFLASLRSEKYAKSAPIPKGRGSLSRVYRAPTWVSLGKKTGIPQLPKLRAFTAASFFSSDVCK